MRELNETTTRGRREETLRQRLVSHQKSLGYIHLVGHLVRYHLALAGESCLYGVPSNRRGMLQVLRGRRIRVVCIQSGRYARGLTAGAVDAPDR